MSHERTMMLLAGASLTIGFVHCFASAAVFKCSLSRVCIASLAAFSKVLEPRAANGLMAKRRGCAINRYTEVPPSSSWSLSAAKHVLEVAYDQY